MNTKLDQVRNKIRKFDLFWHCKNKSDVKLSYESDDLARLSGLVQKFNSALVLDANFSYYGKNHLIELDANVSLDLMCNTCNDSFSKEININKKFLFVKNENDFKAKLDFEIVEELNLSDFDLIQFIEDELILSLPLVPKHDNCYSDSLIYSSSSKNYTSESNIKENPFRLLKKFSID